MAEQGRRKLTKAERAKIYLMKHHFPQNAFFIFNKAKELVSQVHPHDGAVLLDEMLHSILFLGNIHASIYPPDVIFADSEIYDETMNVFPRPFSRYREDVPLRTPFSYFLELVVRCFGESNEDAVKGELAEILPHCKRSDLIHPLISSVICVCQTSQSCKKYYGCSLTCSGDIEREIMTAVSCLHVWHQYVSSAVLGVFPEDTTEAQFPDGTITLPRSIECRAYDIENMMLKPPCKRCHELYSLPNPTDNRNNPGNCAETEAISNLLTNEEEVENDTEMQNRVLLERDEIEERMRIHFETKMNERMNSRRNRDNYSIDRIYVYHE